MFPPNFSSHELYARHRNPQEIARIEKQNRELTIRNYQYGEPVITKSKAQKPAKPVVSIPLIGTRHAFPLTRFFEHFFSLFASRHQARL